MPTKQVLPSKPSMTSRAKIYGLAGLVLLTVLIIQFARIERPYVGHFASYQGTVMASMADNMLQDNFSSIILPKTHAIMGGERSLHLNQYPFPSVIAALGVRFMGGSLEFWGRFQAIFFNLLSLLLISLIATRLFGNATGWISAAVYALSPYTLIYGQAFMSESMALFCFLAAIYFYLMNSEKGKIEQLYWTLSALFFGLALTGRIHFVVFYPVFLIIALADNRRRFIGRTMAFGIISILIPAAWYAHTYFAGLEAGNLHTSIFLQLTMPKESGASLLLQPEYLQRVFTVLSANMLTPLIFPFMLLGFLLMDRRAGFYVLLWGLVCGLLICVLAPEKVTDHDFYLYGLFPFLVLASAEGIHQSLGAIDRFKHPGLIAIALIVYLGVSARFFVPTLWKAPEHERHEYNTALKVRDRIGPQDKVIIFGDSTGILRHYLGRASWSISPMQLGKGIAAYRKNPRLSGIDMAKVARTENAMRKLPSWFDFLKGSGAAYLVAAHKEELDHYPQLKSHIEAHAQPQSDDSDPYYFFKLSQPGEPA